MKKILYFLLGVAITGGLYGYYLWNKPHEDVQASKPAAVVEAAQLLNDFVADENAANAKYLGQTVQVSGTVKESSEEEGLIKVMLDAGNENFGIYCTLDSAGPHPRKTFSSGEKLTLKGKCDGINLDVQLSRCFEVK
jgi:hypothetical protein